MTRRGMDSGVRRCDACSEWLDADHEPEAYDDVNDRWYCRFCRAQRDSGAPEGFARYRDIAREYGKDDR